MNARRHDSNFAMPRRNNSRTIWPNQPCAAVLEELPRPNHVESWNSFSDADDKFDLCIGGLHDCVRCIRRWDKDQRAVGASSIHRFLNAVEHRPTLVRRATFPRSYAADNLRSVFSAGFGVECAFAPSEALHDDSRRFVYKDTHECLHLAATLRFVSGHAFRHAETKLLKFRTPTRRNCQRLKPH